MKRVRKHQIFQVLIPRNTLTEKKTINSQDGDHYKNIVIYRPRHYYKIILQNLSPETELFTMIHTVNSG